MSDRERILAEVLPRIRRPKGGAEVLWIPDLLAVEFVAGPDLLTLSRRDLAVNGLTPDELMAPALAHLRHIVPDRPWIPVETVPGLRIAWAPDGLAASRALILRDLFDPFPLEGVIVALPAPDQLLCVALEPLTDQVFWCEGQTLHTVPIRRTEDEVVANPPPELLQAFERLALLGTSVAADA